MWQSGQENQEPGQKPYGCSEHWHLNQTGSWESFTCFNGRFKSTASPSFVSLPSSQYPAEQLCLRPLDFLDVSQSYFPTCNLSIDADRGVRIVDVLNSSPLSEKICRQSNEHIDVELEW